MLKRVDGLTIVMSDSVEAMLHAIAESGPLQWTELENEPKPTIPIKRAEELGLLRRRETDGGWGGLAKFTLGLTSKGWAVIGREPPPSPVALAWRRFLQRIGIRRS